MDQAYFDRMVQFETETIASSEARLAQPSKGTPASRANYAYGIFRKRFQSLILRYSRGEEVAEIANDFPAAVESWRRYLSMEGHKDPVPLGQDISDYVRALWLVSLGIVFAAKDDVFAQLLACIGAPGQDALLERLIATRIKNRPSAPGLLFPKPYEALYQAIDALPAERTQLFNKFLKAWYPTMGSMEVYWHDNHKGPDGGGFFGYWCIEAAGVVAAFKIDDSGFRDAPYYPKDLAAAGLAAG